MRKSEQLKAEKIVIISHKQKLVGKKERSTIDNLFIINSIIEQRRQENSVKENNAKIEELVKQPSAYGPIVS